MPPINLVKAHAYGNDFLIAPEQEIPAGVDRPNLTRTLCDRHRGIGADGVMFVKPTEMGAVSHLFNADGSRAEVSGNGVRCLAAWLARDRSLSPGARITVETDAGPKRLTLLDTSGCRFEFRADMGRPADVREETVDVRGQPLKVVVLNVGNPQCVVLGPATQERLHALGSVLAVHPFFPEGTNVELADVESPDRVRIMIWERGVGPTESSGTGTCAAAVAAATFGGAQRTVDVVAPGGAQRVEWTDETIWLTGWAEVIAEIEWLAVPFPER
jgi:diaminopimelate epimerase